MSRMGKRWAGQMKGRETNQLGHHVKRASWQAHLNSGLRNNLCAAYRESRQRYLGKCRQSESWTHLCVWWLSLLFPTKTLIAQHPNVVFPQKTDWTFFFLPTRDIPFTEEQRISYTHTHTFSSSQTRNRRELFTGIRHQRSKMSVESEAPNERKKRRERIVKVWWKATLPSTADREVMRSFAPIQPSRIPNPSARWLIAFHSTASCTYSRSISIVIYLFIIWSTRS